MFGFEPIEVIVRQNGEVDFGKSKIWMDKERRGILIILDESSHIAEPEFASKNYYHGLSEAVVYESGVIRAGESSKLLHHKEPRRALVVTLDEPPVHQETTGPTGDQPMKRPLQVGDRVFDLENVEDMIDLGDCIYITFYYEHQPPYLYLQGDSANALREYFNGKIPKKEKEFFSDNELKLMEAQIAQGRTLDAITSLRLITALRQLRVERDEIISEGADFIQFLFDHCEHLAGELSENKVLSVKCLLGDGCKVRADGRCVHTDYLHSNSG